MSASAELNLSMKRGDSYSLELTFTNPNATAFDLTGRTFLAQLRSWADSATVLATFTIAVGSAAHKRLISLTPAQTAALTRDAVWDFQATRTSDGYVETWLAGAVVLTKDVSRV